MIENATSEEKSRMIDSFLSKYHLSGFTLDEVEYYLGNLVAKNTTL